MQLTSTLRPGHVRVLGKNSSGVDTWKSTGRNTIHMMLDGKTINFTRHNGIEKIGCRCSDMHIRRRMGKSQATKETAMFGVLTATSQALKTSITLRIFSQGSISRRSSH